jgi:hypothetical protein
MNERLTKLIDDYGHAMYNLGECSGDYESRQTRITLKKLQNYINMWLIGDDSELVGVQCMTPPTGQIFDLGD